MIGFRKDERVPFFCKVKNKIVMNKALLLARSILIKSLCGS